MYTFVKKITKMNNAIVDKIKRLRLQKGLNHADMADKLNITRSAYQRLEIGETYSWAKYLEEILHIFEMNPKAFFADISSKQYNKTDPAGTGGYIVEALIQENKEIYEKLIAAKDEQIALLKSLLGK
jgi:transcriptional regulator with XRE-family HTH domain